VKIEKKRKKKEGKKKKNKVDSSINHCPIRKTLSKRLELHYERLDLVVDEVACIA
jgi:hypothetical protein